MDKLTIASYNIHKCVGLDKKFRPDRIIDVIKELNADVLALQETDQRFGRCRGLLDLGYLKKETGFIPVPVQGKTTHSLGWHGNAIFLKDGHIDTLVQIKLPGVEPRGALLVELSLPAGPLRIITAHFGLLRHSRQRQAQEIINILRQRPIMPTLMLGDLNEWRRGRGSSLRNLDMFFDFTQHALPSFPSLFPIFALDRVLSYPLELIETIEIHSSRLARISSDHLPIKARINLVKAHKYLATHKMQAKDIQL